MTEQNKKIDWLRMILCAVVLCVVAATCLIFYQGRGADIIADLSSDDKRPNLLWLAENAFAIIPVLLMVGVSELFYIGKKKNIVTDLIADGYPFFAGEITLKKKFNYNGGNCVLNIEGKYGYAEVLINGQKAVKSYF